MKLKTNNIRAFFVQVLIIALTLVFCSPILQSPKFIIPICICVLFLLFTRLSSKQIKKNGYFLICFIVYSALTIVYRVLGISDDAWGASMLEYSFFISFIALILADDCFTDNCYKRIFWVIIIIILFNIIENIALSILFPEFNNDKSVLDPEFLSQYNIGDSRFYTMSVFFSGICFFFFLNCTKSFFRIICLFASVVSAVYVFVYCNKGSSIVYLALLLFFMAIAKKAGPNVKLVRTLSFTIVFSIIVLVLFRDLIVDLILTFSPSDRISTRLVTLIDPNNSSADTITVTGRTELYLMSIKTWLKNPLSFLFGVGDIRTDIVNVGNHADFLDALARYGVVGSGVLYSAIYRIFRYLFGGFGKYYKPQLQVIVFIFILSGFTKSVLAPDIGCVLFVFLPITASYFKLRN